MRNRQGVFFVFAFVGRNRFGSADGSPGLPVDRVRFLMFSPVRITIAGQRMSGRAVESGRLRRKTPERPLPLSSCAGGSAALPFGRGVFVVSAGYETIAQALCFPFPVFSGRRYPAIECGCPAEPLGRIVSEERCRRTAAPFRARRSCRFFRTKHHL